MKLPATGRAMVIEEYGQPMKFVELPITPPSPGAILVKIETATLCGSDVHLWQGAYARHGIELPLMPGHEAVGTVVALGEGAELDSLGATLRTGDRVVWDHEACCHCYSCTVLRLGTLCADRRLGYMTSIQEHPFLNGTIGDYSYVLPRSGRLRVPDAVASTWAAAASCAFRTVLNGVNRLGQVDHRHNVVIQGSGPLGLFATAVLSTLTPRKLIVVGAPEARLEVASSYGADEVISIEAYPNPADRADVVRALTDGRGADIVCDCSGAPGVIGEGLDLAAPNGRYLVLGSTSAPPQLIDAATVVMRNLTLFGSASGEIDACFHALAFLERHRDRFDWDLLVSGPRYPLDQAGLAFERMRTYEEIKPVIEPHRTEDR